MDALAFLLSQENEARLGGMLDALFTARANVLSEARQSGILIEESDASLALLRAVDGVPLVEKTA